MLTRREFLLSLVATALESGRIWAEAPASGPPPAVKPELPTDGAGDFARELAALRARRPVPVSDRLRRFSARYASFARSRWDVGPPAYGPRGSFPEEPLPTGSAVLRGAGAGSIEVVHRREGTRQGRADWPAVTRQLKQAAQSFGAPLVGVTRVDPLWLYAMDRAGGPVQVPGGLTTAVVLALEADDEAETPPSTRAAAASRPAYVRMAAAAVSTGRFLTDLGWRAQPSVNDTALSIALAVDDGLGELGRNGLLITRQFGPRVRLCKVFADARLVSDTAVTFEVRKFCALCTKCAEECPSGAISRGEPAWEGPSRLSNPGALKWYVNGEKCLAFRRANGNSCDTCVRSCLFNNPAG